MYLSTFMSEILNKLGVNRPNLLDKMFCNSKMLSADVDAGFDPIYSQVSEINNASFLGQRCWRKQIYRSKRKVRRI